MKKLLALMLAAALTFSLAACGNREDAPQNDDTIPPTNTEVAVDNPPEEPSNDDEDALNEEKGSQKLSIGDLAATDAAEFVLQEFEFTNGLYSNYNDPYKHLSPLTDEQIDALARGDYLESGVYSDEEIAAMGSWGIYLTSDVYSTDNGKVLAYVSFTMKNIGKTILKSFAPTSTGNSREMGAFIEIDYDGYLFRGHDNGFIIDITDMENGHTVFNGFNSILELGVLEDAHIYRGCIEVPEEVMNNTDTPLYINVFLPCENGEFETLTYKIR